MHDKFRISPDLCEFLVQSEAQATRTFTEAEVQELVAEQVMEEKETEEKVEA